MSRAEEPKLGEALALAAEVADVLLDEGMVSEMRSPMDGGR